MDKMEHIGKKHFFKDSSAIDAISFVLFIWIELCRLSIYNDGNWSGIKDPNAFHFIFHWNGDVLNKYDRSATVRTMQVAWFQSKWVNNNFTSENWHILMHLHLLSPQRDAMCNGNDVTSERLKKMIKIFIKW